MSDKQYMCLLVYISVNSALEMGIFKLSWPVTHTIKMDTNTHTPTLFCSQLPTNK